MINDFQKRFLSEPCKVQTSFDVAPAVLSALRDKILGYGERINFANIDHAETLKLGAENRGVTTGREVEVDDGEMCGPCLHLGQQRGRQHMDAGKGKESPCTVFRG